VDRQASNKVGRRTDFQEFRLDCPVVLTAGSCWNQDPETEGRQDGSVQQWIAFIVFPSQALVEPGIGNRKSES